MRVLLMHPDRDWDQERTLSERFRVFRREPTPIPQPHKRALIEDLALETVVKAMGDSDEFLCEVAELALLPSTPNDLETILHRQAILQDCLHHADIVREIYAVVLETIDGRRKYYIGDYTRYPSSILYSAIEAMQMFATMLRKLRVIADAHAADFTSPGFSALFTMLRQELDDEYLARIQQHLTDLRFRAGVSISAQLGRGNEGTGYVLHPPRRDARTWLGRLIGKGPPGYTFYIHERDEAGARALSELQDRGIHLVANALAQSTEHILGFFERLRAELAFYVGCLNLHDRLTAIGAPSALPKPTTDDGRIVSCTELYDVCLALHTTRRVVGNAVEATGKRLVIVTGANQGGKSTFLRSLGVAQLMMQCGMFVGAESFAADLCTGVFTHYKREEDATMTSGKLDEELARMSTIADVIQPGAIVLFNESFASTNEREGSEIARQIVRAFLDRGIKVVFVTHLFDFARGVFDQHAADALFLRADRRADGTRTFKLYEGEPQETSYGEDLYKEIFGRDSTLTSV